METERNKNWWQWPLAVICIAFALGWWVGRSQGYAAGFRQATADPRQVVLKIIGADDVATAPWDAETFDKAVAQEVERQRELARERETGK